MHQARRILVNHHGRRGCGTANSIERVHIMNLIEIEVLTWSDSREHDHAQIIFTTILNPESWRCE